MFKNKIPEIMKTKKKDLRYLIRVTGIPRTTLQRLNHDIDLGKISFKNLVAISEALRCKVSDLFEIQQ